MDRISTAIQPQIVIQVQFYCSHVNSIQTAPELPFAVEWELKNGPSV
jgi:hypothetical protein